MSFPSTDIWNINRTFTLDEFLNAYVMADHELLGSGKIQASEFVGALPNGGALTDAASIEVPNNRMFTLTTAQSTLSLNVTPSDGTVPNFAIEITTSVACTVVVTSTVSGTTKPLKYSAVAGNELESGKVYQLTCVGGCWTVSEFSEPAPAPSYTYLILQNFIDGHTIGTPDTGGYTSQFYNTYPSDKSAIGFSGVWSDTNLVSTTVGSQLLYSKNGFDFSQYSITAGQIPFGYVVRGDNTSEGGQYSNIALPSAFTLETWFNPLDADMIGNLFTLRESSAWSPHIMVKVRQDTIYLYYSSDEILNVSLSTSLVSDTWYHIALTCDGTNMYIFLDGHLIGTLAISSVSGLAAFLETVDTININDADWWTESQDALWFAQIALCDSCKWTSDFTVPTTAY